MCVVACVPTEKVRATPGWRNPLVLSLSADGVLFDRAFAVANCLLHPYSNPEQPNGCTLRNRAGKGHAPGAQYPQGLVVKEQNLFVSAFSVNKEDIWVTSTPLDALMPGGAVVQ
jgi:hypothetical protein